MKRWVAIFFGVFVVLISSVDAYSCRDYLCATSSKNHCKDVYDACVKGTEFKNFCKVQCGEIYKKDSLKNACETGCMGNIPDFRLKSRIGDKVISKFDSLRKMKVVVSIDDKANVRSSLNENILKLTEAIIDDVIITNDNGHDIVIETSSTVQKLCEEYSRFISLKGIKLCSGVRMNATVVFRSISDYAMQIKFTSEIEPPKELSVSYEQECFYKDGKESYCKMLNISKEMAKEAGKKAADEHYASAINDVKIDFLRKYGLSLIKIYGNKYFIREIDKSGFTEEDTNYKKVIIGLLKRTNKRIRLRVLKKLLDKETEKEIKEDLVDAVCLIKTDDSQKKLKEIKNSSDDREILAYIETNELCSRTVSRKDKIPKSV